MEALNTRSGSTPPQPKHGGSSKGKLLLAIVAVAIAALALAWFVLGLDDVITGGDNGGTVEGPSAAPFTIRYPKGWQPVSGEELAKLPGQPLAVVKNKDKRGAVIVSRGGRVPSNYSKLADQLSKNLSKRFPDFKKTRSRTIRVRAGNAFYFSYIRTKTGTVNTIMLVPTGNRSSYSLNTVTRGRDREAALEAAKMILSFNVPNSTQSK